jgi:hypothetical protein
VEPKQVARRAGTQPVPYRIVVSGHLQGGLLLGGWSVRDEEGYCVITGDILDQAQLIGVIEWLGERGVELVSLEPLRSCEDAIPGGSPPTSHPAGVSSVETTRGSD